MIYKNDSYENIWEQVTEEDLYDEPLTEESAGGFLPKRVPNEKVPQNFKKVVQSIMTNVKEICGKSVSTTLGDRFFSSTANWMLLLTPISAMAAMPAKAAYAHFMNEKDTTKQLNSSPISNKYTLVFNTSQFSTSENKAMRDVAADALKKSGFKGGYAGKYILARWVGWYYMKGKDNTIYAARFKNNEGRIKIQVICVEGTKENEEMFKRKDSFRESIENASIFSNVELL